MARARLIYIRFCSRQISNKVQKARPLSILSHPLQFSSTRRRKKTSRFKIPHTYVPRISYFFLFLQFVAIDTSSGVDEFLLERRKSLCLRYESQNCCKEYPALGRVVYRHCFEKNLNSDFYIAILRLYEQHVAR